MVVKILLIIGISITILTTLVIGIVSYFSDERKFFRRRPLTNEGYTALEARINNIAYGKEHKTRQDEERARLLKNTLGKKYRLRAAHADKTIKLFHFIDGEEAARRIVRQSLTLREEIERLERQKIGEALAGGKEKMNES